jgi:uncharacterized protein (DUF342 family)
MDKDYSIEFNLTEGGLVASIRIVPTATEVSGLTVDDLLAAINDERITFGLIPEAVDQIVKDKTINQWVVIARGQKPEQGKDGYIKFHFDTSRTKVTIKEDASGKVNLKDLHLIQNVKKGDPLCELVNPQPGTPGMTVKCEEIPGKLGVSAKLPGAKNVTYSADRNQIFAAIGGMVIWLENAVNVEPSYVVHDVDASVGNIRFNGSVVVQGEVGDGYEIHAGEDIVIATTVGKVVLEAGGNIKIAGGIMGQEEAMITANGMIHAKFIQDAHVISEKEIVVDGYIRNSLVSAIGPVIIKNPNGFITTSQVSSDSCVYCHTVGQETAGEKTVISIGRSPVLHREQHRMKEEISEKIQKFIRFQSSLAKLRLLKATSELSNQQEALYNKILDSMETLRRILNQQNAKIIEIVDKIHKTHQGNIYIEGAVYDQTDINIGIASTTITGTKSGVHFYLKDGEIKEGEFTLAPVVKKILESSE